MRIQKNWKRASLVALVAGGLLTFVGCGKKDSGDDDEDASGTGSISGIGSSSTAIANALAAAVPTSLSLAALPQGAGASLTLAEETEVNAAKDSPDVERVRDQSLLKGEGDCLAAAAGGRFRAITEETCYQFDQDMIYGTAEQGTSGVAKTLGTKTGLNANGEACLVSFARGKIARVKQEVDQSKGMLNMALCQAKKDLGTTALPAAIGDKLDLKVHADNALAKLVKKPTIDEFSMTYIADVDGRPVYETLFKATDGSGNVRQFAVRHRSEEDGEQYSGSLRISIKPPTGGQSIFGDSKKSFVSIGYGRKKMDDASYQNTYELRIAAFGEDWQDVAIDANGVVDFNARIDDVATSATFGQYKKSDGTVVQNSNEAVSGIMYIAFSENETSGAQSVAYWQNPGGNYYENARGMVFSATRDATTNLYSGCANAGSAHYTGNGISIRRSLREATAETSLTPRGFYHPFVNTQAAGGGQGCSPSLVTNGSGEFKYIKENCPGQQFNLKFSWAPLAATGADPTLFVESQNDAVFTLQCFKQDAAGLYKIDTAKTTSVDGYDLVRTSTVSPPSISDARRFDPSKAKGTAPAP